MFLNWVDDWLITSILMLALLSAVSYNCHQHACIRSMQKLLYKHKDKKKITYELNIIDAYIESNDSYRRNLEDDIVKAITENHVVAYIQSQIDQNGLVTGAELLARWHHPKHGAISPLVFIPVARKTGYLSMLTQQILQQACTVLDVLSHQGTRLSLSINICPTVLADREFIQTAKKIISDSAILNQNLIFEITENIDITKLPVAVQHMEELHAAGIRFSIDDFGTGYANLDSLIQMPIHELKIDKKLINGLPDDNQAKSIVLTVLYLARQFNLHVVAEGVETQSQADFLFEHRCDAIQGYLLAKPMSIDNWIEQQAYIANTCV